MNKRNKWRILASRSLALLLTLVMLVGIVPVQALGAQTAVTDTPMIKLPVEEGVPTPVPPVEEEPTPEPPTEEEPTPTSPTEDETILPVEKEPAPESPDAEETDPEMDPPEEIDPGTGEDEVYYFPERGTDASLPTSDPDDHLKLKKYVRYKGGDNYTLTLESYVDGYVDEKLNAMDIVMVIDVTGSMHQKMVTTDTPIPVYNYTTKRVSKSSSAGARGYMDYLTSDGKYAKLVKYTKSGNTFTSATTVRGENNKFYVRKNNAYVAISMKNGKWVDGSGNAYTPKTSPSDTNASRTQFYASGSVTRMDAMLNAVTNFVKDVQADAKKKAISHRIALVSFQEHEITVYPFYSGLWKGSTMYSYVSGTDAAGTKLTKVTSTHYAGAFQTTSDATTKSILQSLSKMMYASYYSTGTFPKAGVDMAKEAFKYGCSGSNRQRVTVFFTDGMPNRDTWAADKFGAGALAGAAELKGNTYKSKICAVGIFEGADSNSLGKQTNDETAGFGNWFLQRLSSNYSGSGNPDPKKGYYVSAETADQLSEAFDKVLQLICLPGGAYLPLSNAAVLNDVISDNFKLPDSATTSDIKVYTANYIEDKTFSDWVAFPEASVSISTDRKTIHVSNFDYGQEWVGVKDKLDGSKEYHGKKLIVEIPIVATSSGGNGLETNTGASSVTEGVFVDAFAIPRADIPACITITKKVTGNELDTIYYRFNAKYVTFMQGDSETDYDYDGNEGDNGNYLSGKTYNKDTTFSLRENGSFVIKNVYVGSEFTLKELVSSQYDVRIQYRTTTDGEFVDMPRNADGSCTIPVNSRNIEILVTNTVKYVELTLTKYLIGDSSHNARTFSFLIEKQVGNQWIPLDATSFPMLEETPSVSMKPNAPGEDCFPIISFDPNSTKPVILRVRENIPANTADIFYDDSIYYVTVAFDANQVPYVANITKDDVTVGKLEFTNYETTAVVITKNVVGNSSDYSKYFDFTFTVTMPDGKTSAPYEYDRNNSVPNAGSGKFSLNHGSKVTLIKIPYGATIKVKETNPKPYTTVVAVNGKTFGSHTGSSVTEASLTCYAGSNTIAFENRYDQVLDTGIALDALPFILVLALTAMTGAALFFRKRRSCED